MPLVLKYPLGIQTFSEIREEGYVYVDKTALIYDLISTGKVYFLSRPRRFGKSLLISTFEALFQGQKSLFDGLAIANTDYDFANYPVIKLEFSQDEFNTADSLRDYIYTAVNDIAEHYNIELKKQSYSQRFGELLKKLHEKTGQKVVLLIDEYDKPILNNLNKPILSDIKQVIAAFYGVIKPLDEHLKFVFITGVSKFAKISVLSGMNSPRDITMVQRYATLCGVTQQELEHYFVQAIDELTVNQSIDRPKMLAKIKHWYNGYYFEENAISVYNPYSLLGLFTDQKFNNYWFATGTPKFLMNLLKSKDYNLKDLTQFKIGEAGFEASEPEEMEIQSVFVQTGYLTIHGYDGTLFTLGFPNYEVKKSFYDSLSASYSHLGKGASQSFIVLLTKHINAGQIEDFFTTLKAFFANIPYDLNVNLEKYYQSLFYAIFTLIGFNIAAEIHTNQGRIDCIIQTSDTIYIIEFKLNDTKQAAMAQIIDNQYPQKYQTSNKKIVLLGVEFNQKTRNIGDYCIG